MYVPSLQNRNYSLLRDLQETFTVDDLLEDLDDLPPASSMALRDILCGCHEDVLKMIDCKVITALRTKLDFNQQTGVLPLVLDYSNIVNNTSDFSYIRRCRP